MNATDVINQTDSQPPKLLTILANIQKKSRQNNTEFSKRLGIPLSTWQLTVTNKKPIHETVIVAIVKAFPELHEEVIEYLSSL